MGENKTLTYMGGKQAGCIGLLTVLAMGYKVKCVVAYDDVVKDIAKAFSIPIVSSIRKADLAVDLLLCVHGREIVPAELLRLPKVCINVHPCLYKYKGMDPINRLLKDKETRASVGVHKMTANVDHGEVILEKFQDVKGKTAVEVYNELYTLYSLTIKEALESLLKEV